MKKIVYSTCTSNSSTILTYIHTKTTSQTLISIYKLRLIYTYIHILTFIYIIHSIIYIYIYIHILLIDRAISLGGFLFLIFGGDFRGKIEILILIGLGELRIGEVRLTRSLFKPT